MVEFWLSGMRSALRGRSFLAVLVVGIALICLAFLAGNFSPRQPRTVALDVGFSGVRITLVLLALFWVQELVTKEIERKSVLFSLTYPVSRTAYLLARFVAVLSMAVLAILFFGFCLQLAVLLTGGAYDQEFSVSLGGAYWATMMALLVDLAVVAAFTLWMSSISTVAGLPLACGLVFAIAGKAMGATLDYLAAGADGDQKMIQQFGTALDIIRWILPDLSRLDWRSWPMYGVTPQVDQMVASMLMGASYAGLLLLLACRTMDRREFS